MLIGNESKQKWQYIWGISFLLIGFLISGCLGSGKLPQTSIPPSETSLPSETGTQLPSVSVTTTFAILPSLTPQYQMYVVGKKSLDVWDSPENENKYLHLLTQLVLGEKVVVLDKQTEWSEIAAVEQPTKNNPLGYSGWVRNEDLIYGWPTSQEFIVVMKPSAYIYTQPDGLPNMSVFLDTRLIMVSSTSDWVQVALPDGGDGWMRLADVRITSNLDESIPTDG